MKSHRMILTSDCRRVSWQKAGEWQRYRVICGISDEQLERDNPRWRRSLSIAGKVNRGREYRRVYNPCSRVKNTEQIRRIGYASVLPQFQCNLTSTFCATLRRIPHRRHTPTRNRTPQNIQRIATLLRLLRDRVFRLLCQAVSRRSSEGQQQSNTTAIHPYSLLRDVPPSTPDFAIKPVKRLASSPHYGSLMRPG